MGKLRLIIPRYNVYGEWSVESFPHQNVETWKTNKISIIDFVKKCSIK